MSRFLLGAFLCLCLTVPAQSAAHSNRESNMPTTRYRLAEITAPASGDSTATLMTKLSMAQFHHLRAMHGIAWATTSLLTSPGLAIFGGLIMAGGAVGGALTGNTGMMVLGVVVIVVAASLFVAAIPTLAVNIVQAMATAARVEELRKQLLGSADPVAFLPPSSSERVMLSAAIAF